jgi:hypothetical protein
MIRNLFGTHYNAPKTTIPISDKKEVQKTAILKK